MTDQFLQLFKGEPQDQARENLSRFKQLLETGEIATIDGQSKGGKS